MSMFPVSSNTPELLRLSVLNWLLVNRAEGCTINAINWAARRCPIVEIVYFYTNIHVRRNTWVKDCICNSLLMPRRIVFFSFAYLT